MGGPSLMHPTHPPRQKRAQPVGLERLLVRVDSQCRPIFRDGSREYPVPAADRGTSGFGGKKCRSLFTLLLSNHQAVEEGAVVLQGLAEIFSRDIIALIPLTLQ